jgi:ATP-dependent helicase HrpA
LVNTASRIKKIKSLLPAAMARERMAARRELRRLSGSSAKSLSAQKLEQRWRRLEKRLTASVQRRTLRQDNLPEIRYNEDLPITAKKDEIIRAIAEHAVIIVSGETGSGKTTQIPKFCLAAGRGIDGFIGHTQPRRIATTSVAYRIAEELGQELGRAVGYKIRFQDRTPKNAYLKLMTDGILLAETQHDRYLGAYDTIIVDEAHERSLNIDFILGIMKTLLKQRDDLKLIITSATIDTQKFSQAFDHAPVIEVSGRMYPVEVRYLPVEEAAAANGDSTHVELAARVVAEIHSKGSRGDILVFMPTEQDIRDTCELITAGDLEGACVLPLFARLTAAEQSRVFRPMVDRKIIVATNVAETSLTIPGIKYVIDSGLARISRYLPRSRTTSLPVLPVSRSSADQRKGRCGRVENGVCIRLYSESDYESRPMFTAPEIVRANLAEVILRMIALRLGAISDFAFIDRPDAKSIKDGFDLLFELGAITAARSAGTGGREPIKLTATGALMAGIPLDPRLSRMLIEAGDRGCVDEIAVIAAALSIQDPRERPAEKAQEADRMQAGFNDPNSDFVTLLNIWNRYYRAQQKAKSANAMKRFCREHYLSYRRMREWRDIYLQIAGLLAEQGLGKTRAGFEPRETNLSLDPVGSRYRDIHQSVLSGFLSNIAEKKEKNMFRAAYGKEVMIFPGSGLFDKAAGWIVAAEIVETSRVFARMVANIDSAWLEALGKNLCRRTYLNPHWEKNRGEVVASEQLSLFGLVIVPERKVSYGRINPREAADIFIQRALIDGDVKKPFGFMNHNRRLIDEIKSIEDRIRRRDLLIGGQDIFAFYKQKLNQIFDTRSLSGYLKQKGGDQFLRMKKEDLLRYRPDAVELSRYPERIKLGSHTLNCSYRFDPGKEVDGITVKVPAGIAPLVPAPATDWLVPGLYREKIAALIKGLPKAYRRKLVPVKESVDIIAREMPKAQGSLLAALSDFIYKRFGLDIPAAAWSQQVLPDYLRMRIAITAPDGRELRAGRDATILSRPVEAEVRRKGLEAACRQWEKTGITRWDFGDLPDFVSANGTESGVWVAYPALKKAAGDKSVNLRLFLRCDDALAVHMQGVAALYRLHFARDLKFLKRQLVLPAQAAPVAAYFGGAANFAEKMFERAVGHLFAKNIRSQKDFFAHAEAVAPKIIGAGREILDQVLPVLAAYHETRSLISKIQQTSSDNPFAAEFFNDVLADLTRLVPESFIDLYDPDRLDHLARYITAVGIRARRALIDFEKDQAKAKEVDPFRDSLNRLLGALSVASSAEKRTAVEEFYWMLEEYKVSIFAQELKTAFPVSKKRLQQKLHQIERML